MNKEKIEKFVFGLLMAVIMVYGMEVYNAILRNGFSINEFLIPISEFLLITVIVILLQEYFGGPVVRFIVFRILKIKPYSKFFVYILATFMVFIMCPTMSLIATLLFKPINHNLLLVWFNTFKANLPMAFIWQLFVAGPTVRYITKKLFSLNTSKINS